MVGVQVHICFFFQTLQENKVIFPIEINLLYYNIFKTLLNCSVIYSLKEYNFSNLFFHLTSTIITAIIQLVPNVNNLRYSF